MRIHSHNTILSSQRKYISMQTAKAKNNTSRTNDLRATLKGRVIAIEPATTAVMNDAAPISSPIASEPELTFIATKVENTSGLPFPKARKVTPALDCITSVLLSCSILPYRGKLSSMETHQTF